MPLPPKTPQQETCGARAAPTSRVPEGITYTEQDVKAHATRTDEEVDEWVVARRRGGIEISPIAEAPWIDELERVLPHRLPAAFRSLVARYRFPPVTVGQVDLFGNLGTRDRSELVVACMRDTGIWTVVHRNGLLPIGRSSSGSYDPICLNLRERAKVGDSPVVQLDHEAILVFGDIHVVRTIANGFVDLLLTAE
jgi:hypothetical protein